MHRLGLTAANTALRKADPQEICKSFIKKSAGPCKNVAKQPASYHCCMMAAVFNSPPVYLTMKPFSIA